MRSYELVLVLAPGGKTEDTDKLLQKIKKDFESNGGKIEKEEEWGKKPLAYQMKKYDEGVFYFYELLIEPATVNDFEQRLKMEDQVLRYLMVKKEEVSKKTVSVKKKADDKDEVKDEVKKKKPRAKKSEKKE